MSLKQKLNTFRSAVQNLKKAQSIKNGGRTTPIYINLDAFALKLGWEWNGTVRTVKNQVDMKEFFTYYVPILNDLDIIIYQHLNVSTFDKGIIPSSSNHLTLVANASPSTLNHTFDGSTFTYDFRQVVQCNAEHPWLSAMQMDDCEALTPRPGIPTNHPQYDSRVFYVSNGQTIWGNPNFPVLTDTFEGASTFYYSALDWEKNRYRFRSIGNRVWSRFMHEIARQKMAGYHGDSDYTFSTTFTDTMKNYSYSAGDTSDVSYNALVDAKNIATLQDLRQTIILFWRDCVRYLKGENVIGSDGVPVNITTGGNRAFSKVIHYSNGVGALTNYAIQPWNALRGIEPVGITNNLTAQQYTTGLRQRRIMSDYRVYYNKSYIRSEETFNAGSPVINSNNEGSGGIYNQPNSGHWWRNNDAGYYNISYIASQYGNPTDTQRLFPSGPIPYPNQGINILGPSTSPKVGLIKTFIASQSNADSYGTSIYFTHGCGEEWKTLIEAGVRTSRFEGKYKSISQTQNAGTFIPTGDFTVPGTFGTDEKINDSNHIDTCSGQITAGPLETYKDLIYWVSSTLVSHIGHLKKQITRNLEYNKAYLTGIIDSNVQFLEIEKLAKKPICAIISPVPTFPGLNALARTHIFKCWPTDPSEYVTSAVACLFKKGDKNTLTVDRPDELMFWAAGNYIEITVPSVTYGSSIGFTNTTFRSANVGAPSNILRWEVCASRIGWEKLVLGRIPLATTPYQTGQLSEICSINYMTGTGSGQTLVDNESYFQSIKWCYDNMLPDSLWANSTGVWWSETGGTASAITSRGLQSLDQPTHKLYPYFKGTGYIGADGIDLYTTGSKTITQANVLKALARYQSNWILRMLQESRKQLDALGA